jgi:lactoylglutathione lyase
MNIKINYLQHIGIPVTDMNRSAAFYERLGFKNVMDAAFTFEGDQGTVRMMKRDAIIIELYQMPEKELIEIRNRKSGHIDHVAFDVDDIDATFSALQENDFNIIEPQPVFLAFWENGCRYFNILGPDGERLEFNQIL